MSGLRLLVCVDGSQGALEAARLAIHLASEHGGEVRAVSVTEDASTARQLDARGRHDRPAGARLAESLRAVLERVSSLGSDQGVRVETAVLEGEPLRAILAEAGDWRPDLILIGRSGRSGPGSPMVGSLAMHIVEFTDWPVVIVPVPGA